MLLSKRIFDIVVSSFFLVLFAPTLCGIALLVALDSRGGVLYKQVRVGKDGKLFRILKFRTMRPASDQKGLITVGDRDPRVTRIGFYLRKYKLDELPQFLNVWLGEMSMVGPRPEVPHYTAMYNAAQQQVLTVTPGITDLAAIEYADESELLAQSPDPEQTYITEIMPTKLRLNLQYIATQNMATDLRILWQTAARILRKR